MQVVSQHCRHVAGLEPKPGNPGGDPSPWTALGVFLSMQEAVQRQLGSDLKDVRVAVQGLGNVGSALCKLLHEAGAELQVAETRSGVAIALAERYHAKVMSPEAILAADCDVLAPCALGAVINPDTIGEVKASIVCGGANNVLASEVEGDVLSDQPIASGASSPRIISATPVRNRRSRLAGLNPSDMVRVRWNSSSTGMDMPGAAMLCGMMVMPSPART